jgi:hypothetical protein
MQNEGERILVTPRHQKKIARFADIKIAFLKISLHLTPTQKTTFDT